MKLSAKRSPALRAAIQVMSTLPRDAASAARRYSKGIVQPEWRSALAQHAPAGRLYQDRLVRPASATVSDQGVKLNAGRSGATSLTRELEFGAAREQYTTYSRRNRSGGGSHRVTRRTKRQFRPYRRGGYAAYPAASEMIPRIAALWVQTVYRTVHEGFEKAGLK